jgi:large subunit ribosomal protein L9e
MVQVDVWFGKKKLLAATRTVTSHVNNMILGTTQGFRYTMRFVYAHFPINANIPADGKKVRLPPSVAAAGVASLNLLSFPA